MTLLLLYTGHFLYDEEKEAEENMGQLKAEQVTCKALHQFMKGYGVDCEVAADMLSRMLEVEPKKRWTSQKLIAHGLFTDKCASRVAREQLSEQMARMNEKVDDILNNTRATVDMIAGVSTEDIEKESERKE